MNWLLRLQALSIPAAAAYAIYCGLQVKAPILFMVSVCFLAGSVWRLADTETFTTKLYKKAFATSLCLVIASLMMIRFEVPYAGAEVVLCLLCFLIILRRAPVGLLQDWFTLQRDPEEEAMIRNPLVILGVLVGLGPCFAGLAYILYLMVTG